MKTTKEVIDAETRKLYAAYEAADEKYQATIRFNSDGSRVTSESKSLKSWATRKFRKLSNYLGAQGLNDQERITIMNELGQPKVDAAIAAEKEKQEWLGNI